MIRLLAHHSKEHVSTRTPRITLACSHPSIATATSELLSINVERPVNAATSEKRKITSLKLPSIAVS